VHNGFWAQTFHKVV